MKSAMPLESKGKRLLKDSITSITSDARVEDVNTAHAPAGLGPMISIQEAKFTELQGGAEPLPEDSNTVHYKTMSWVHAGIVMIAETISLGILSLPQAISTVGFVPGVILILGLGLIATYTGYIVYQFKMRYPGMRSFADAGLLMFGKPGLWIVEILQDLLLVFIMAAHILTFTVMMNTLTKHGLCTIVFGAIGTVVCFIVTIPRTLKANSYVSIFSCLSIAAATIIAMAGISTTSPPLPLKTYAVIPSSLASFPAASMAVSNMILAYNGHIAYPAIISEMRHPHDFPKALIFLESVTITFYIVVAVVIYNYAGPGVSSPAILSAPPLYQKIAFGIAIPTIIVAGVIAALVAAKNCYGHVWAKKPGVMREKTFRARGSWWGIIGVLWLLAWLIASAIPVFGQLIALIGALFGTWFCLGFVSGMWLWMEWKRDVHYDGRDSGWWGRVKESYGKSWGMVALTVVNVMILVMGVALCCVGTYASATSIAASAGKGRTPFSCATNAVLG